MFRRDDNKFVKTAGKVPPGLTAAERNSSYDGLPMTVVLALIVSIATIFFSMRIYVRSTLIKRLGWDDAVCTLALIGTITNVVCFGLNSISGPIGKHLWNVSLADFVGERFTTIQYVVQVTTTPTLGLIKLSIFMLYYDIFNVLSWVRWMIRISAALSSTFYLALTIFNFYVMTPRSGQTIAERFGSDASIEAAKVAIPTTSVGLAIDIILFLMPFIVIFRLQMQRNQKIRASMAFIVGFLAILGSTLSLIFKVKTYGDPDPTYRFILVSFFLNVEMSFGVCIASMPMVYRAVKHRGGKHRAGKQHGFNLGSFLHGFSSSFVHIGSRILHRSNSESRLTMGSDEERKSESVDKESFSTRNTG